MKTKLLSIFAGVGLVVALLIGATDYVNNNTFSALTVTGSFTNSAIASQPLAVDANGKMVPMTMGAGLSWSGTTMSESGSGSPYYRSGTTNIGNLSTSQVIAFSSSLASTNYTPLVSSLFALGGVSFSYSAVTTNGFTVNLSAGVVGGGQINYAAILAN